VPSSQLGWQDIWDESRISNLRAMVQMFVMGERRNHSFLKSIVWLPTKDAERTSPWEWSLTMSVPERAILEMMEELLQQESFHQVDAVMEGMANLRAQLLQRPALP